MDSIVRSIYIHEIKASLKYVAKSTKYLILKTKVKIST